MMKEYECKFCEKKFLRYPSTVKNTEKVFCSRECKSKSQKENNLGKLNPNFKDGKWINRGKRIILRREKLDEFIYVHVKECFHFLDLEKKIKDSGYDIGRNAITRRVKELGISIKHFIPGRNREIPNEELFIVSSVCRRGTIKSRILNDNLIEYECLWCGLGPEWRGLPLVLELDHINGNRFDNRLENLRFLCANCHSQTHTNKGKNRGN